MVSMTHIAADNVFSLVFKNLSFVKFQIETIVYSCENLMNIDVRTLYMFFSRYPRAFG